MTKPPTPTAPPVTLPPGAVRVDPFPTLPGAHSFVSGTSSGSRLRVAYYQMPGETALHARAWFGPDAEGPPGHAHGGSIAAVLDEAAGGAAWIAGHRILIARLCTDFRRPVPLGTDAVVEAWVESVDGRKVTTRARLRDEAGEPFAEAEALCVQLGADQLGALLGPAGS